MTMTDNTPWIIVDEREGVGRVDTWSEYLCVSSTDDPSKFDIAVCGSEVVGEIPADWFDDEGQPIPEYSDDTGCLEVPEYYDGWAGVTKLTGHDGEYLLGELVCNETYGLPITVHAENLAEMSLALMNLGWVAADQGALINSIQQAFAATN